MKNIENFSSLLEAYFNERMLNQIQASPHTIASYSNTFQLLLKYANRRLKKIPSQLTLGDLNAKFLCEFLDNLEKERGISARTRNARLAAIRSFYKYLSYRLPEFGALIQEVLAIPNKRKEEKLIEFLTVEEVEALLAVPNQKTWIGRRDHTLLVVAIQTGLRVSELVKLKWENVHLDQSAYVKCLGKGRKNRITPLSRQSIRYLREWSKELSSATSCFVFSTIHGCEMSSHSVRYLLKKYTAIAVKRSPSLKHKKVTPHVLRHTTAMRLLQSGVDLASIALWLGHESIKTTYIYLQANIEMKEKILEKLHLIKTSKKRYIPCNETMKFLKNLSSIGKSKSEKRQNGRKNKKNG